MKKIISTSLLFFISLLAHSQALNLSDKEKAEVRQTTMDIAKESCIFFWTKTSERTQDLMKMGITLEEQCRCTQDAVKFLVSDDLAAYASHALYEWRTNGPEKLSPKLKEKLDEHSNLVMTSMQGCTKKLMQRR